MKTLHFITEETNKEMAAAMGIIRARDEAVLARECALCNKKIEKHSFRDLQSFEEWKASGLCQSCQDEVFGTTD